MSQTRMRMRMVPTVPARSSSELFLELRRRLTDRDRQLLELVWEHRVLTTHQVSVILFSTPGKGRHRLLELFRMRAVERFQPWVPVGAAPFHWVLGPLGAEVLAAERGITVNELGYRRAATLAICHSQHLGHQVGVNEFFTRLHAHARHTPNANLAKWWSERRCAQLWGDLARPDAYGRWTETEPHTGQPTKIDFFLEHDTGSTVLAKVAAKLGGYTALAEATGITTPVLFWLPSVRREINLRRQLGTPEIPVATAVQTASSASPADSVWLPAGHTGPRRRLIELADTWPTPGEPTTTMPASSGSDTGEDASCR
ncbi:replication-relaxation family protein [Actinomadura sp. SCN-SB]|uniref:replication-relaxation family protein n=1 Tax=Actinomadura sp. SCN-SB TaxID=3373092 RepID=UPI003750B218